MDSTNKPKAFLVSTENIDKISDDSGAVSLNISDLANGGIDFNSRNMDFKVKGDGSISMTAVDSAEFTRFQNATGITPVIIKMQTLNDIPTYLGIGG